jgi:hypothetical protein
MPTMNANARLFRVTRPARLALHSSCQFAGPQDAARNSGEDDTGGSDAALRILRSPAVKAQVRRCETPKGETAIQWRLEEVMSCVLLGLKGLLIDVSVDYKLIGERKLVSATTCRASLNHGDSIFSLFLLRNFFFYFKRPYKLA